MRITNNMLVYNMINNIGNNMSRMDKYQNQLATGKKIQVPSDDPVVAARALKLRTDVSEIDQYTRNIKDAQSWLDITENTLSNIGDVLQRARELTVKGANSSNTPSDMQKISEEIKQLKEQLVHLGNTTYAGRYIFSGNSTDKKLLNDDGTFNINVNTYTNPVAVPPVNKENIKYEIGIGDDIAINVLGGDLFNNGADARTADTNGVAIGYPITAGFPLTVAGNLDITVDGTTSASVPVGGIYANIGALAAGINTALAAPPIGGSVTVSVVAGNRLQFTSSSVGNNSSVAIASTSTAAGTLGLSSNIQINGAGSKSSLVNTMDTLIAALDSGDNAAVGNMINVIDSDMNNLLRIRADVGARQNRLDLTSNRLDSDNINFTKLMSENEDVDMAETIMNLQNEENVYRASLSGGARIIQPTLVDFLK